MKKISVLFQVLSIVLFFSCKTSQEKDPVDFVNPITGTSYTSSVDGNPISIENYGQVIPAVGAPFSMTQWTPQVIPYEKEKIAPFYSNYQALYGFRGTHWPSGLQASDYGSFTIMPMDGKIQPAPELRKSAYSEKTMESSPDFLKVFLESFAVMTELTASRRSGFFRFSWLAPEEPKIVINFNSLTDEGFIKIDTVKNEIFGYIPVFNEDTNEPTGFNSCFVARFDRQIRTYGIFNNFRFTPGASEDRGTNALGAYVCFEPTEKVVQVKIGTSFTSIDNARENLETEIPDWNFTRTRNELRDTWNKLLGTIRLKGGPKEDYYKFYTALYRIFQLPRLYSDVDGTYPEFNNGKNLRKAEGFDYYSDLPSEFLQSNALPLISLIAPAQYLDILVSLVKMAEQAGCLPAATMRNVYSACSGGNFASIALGDAFLKGFDIDIENAWPFMLKEAIQPPGKNEAVNEKCERKYLQQYLEYGYIPIDNENTDSVVQNGQVTLTLQYAYNDWVLSQVAKKMGDTIAAHSLKIRSGNYFNVFDEENKLVNGRDANGNFYPDFWPDAKMPFFLSGTSAENSWYAPHDISGLIEIRGGPAQFKTALSTFFDSGKFRHDNSLLHHTPYLFNFIDDWQQTQKIVKEILHTKYDTTAMGGIAGNENSGQLSSWYVFSAMGIYPMCAGSNEFQLSSPIFDEVTIYLNRSFYQGKKFILRTKEGDYQIYKSVKLNGKKTGTTLQFTELTKGGRLDFK